jgi:type II secretory ATPase GspE/PulE/Tfp pilus assembly ATPase PilB-like protein
MRLIDMGVEPFLVSSTLIGAMAQRLVRKICPHCKTEHLLDRAKLPKDFPLEAEEKMYRGQGCPACRNIGYRGRSGIYELMLMDDAVSEKIMNRAPSSEIVQAARQNGMRLLREDGWLKVKQGVTTPEEVLKCTAH